LRGGGFAYLRSSQGDDEWLEFCKITGAAFAHLEKSPLVPGLDGLSKGETFARVLQAEHDLQVMDKLSAFSLAVHVITEQGGGAYHLVVLDSERKQVTATPYTIANLNRALIDYSAVEARATRGEKVEVVLVSAGPVAQLRRAYPNYFLDTSDFINRVRDIIKSATQS
jgi:putative GTP pyrophosphokinase